MNVEALRTFKNRRSATGLLRKLGVPADRYGDLITARDGGASFEVDTEEAKMVATRHAALTDEGTSTLVKAGSDERAQPVGPTTAKKAVQRQRRAARAERIAAKSRAARAEREAQQAERAAKKAPKAPRVTVSSRARELILAGKTNAEVGAVLKAEFKLDDAKVKAYPSWYRGDLRRKGLLPSEVA